MSHRLTCVLLAFCWYDWIAYSYHLHMIVEGTETNLKCDWWISKNNTLWRQLTTARPSIVRETHAYLFWNSSSQNIPTVHNAGRYRLIARRSLLLHATFLSRMFTRPAQFPTKKTWVVCPKPERLCSACGQKYSSYLPFPKFREGCYTTEYRWNFVPRTSWKLRGCLCSGTWVVSMMFQSQRSNLAWIWTQSRHHHRLRAS